MLRLNEVIQQLISIRESIEAKADGVTEDSPVIIEGNEDTKDMFIQASIEDCSYERRCEGDGEPTGVYITLGFASVEG